MTITRLSMVLLVGGLLASSWGGTPATAENWPQWRGPENNGVSQETGLPLEWSRTENVLWSTPLPGPAGASPVIWEDKIFLTTADETGLLLLMAFDTDGQELWRREVAQGNEDVRGDEGNSASPSPCTDGEHVWTLMGTGDLACYDFDGNQIWKMDLEDRYGKFDIQFGMTSTPVVDGERLYLQLIHTGGAQVVCLDKLTGNEIWRVERPSDATAECEHSYASPVIYRGPNRELLITHGADYVVAHQLSDGREVWRAGGLNPKGNYNPTLRFVASPVVAGDLVVVPSAKNGPVLGINAATAAGDVTALGGGHQWTRDDNTPDVPSPLVADGYVYLCRENGNLQCLDAETGRELYLTRVHRQRHRASPVYADGRVYLTARDGRVTVVKAGPEFEILAQNDLGEDISSSPAISDGRIYLRSFDNLWCIGNE